MLKINAKFTGRNSLGYENGKRYDLVVANKGSMLIRRKDGSGTCPYSSLSAFLKNWDDIKQNAPTATK
jgi:hypothetical protein